MAVNVAGENGSLEWHASINTEDFATGQKIIEKGFDAMAGKAGGAAKQISDNLSQITVKPIDVNQIIGDGVMAELKKVFSTIDGPTQKFIEQLIKLEIELQNINIAQEELNKAYLAGAVTQEDYAKTNAFLVAGYSDIVKKTEEIAKNQKLYDASLASSTGSISDKKDALKNLTQVYESLTAAQRTSPEGEDILKKIVNLKKEIKELDPAKINDSKNAVVSAKAELSKLMDLMARNPNSPLFPSWRKQAAELKESIEKAKVSVEQATNSTAGVEAFASGLRGLVGAFEAGTGIVGLFTNNTEEYEKVTKNAASALALMNGVQEISEVLSKNSALNIYLLSLMRKADTAATTAETVATEVQTAATVEATVAQRGLTAAMLANPAALLIGAIAALAAAYLILRDKESEALTQQKALNESVKDYAKGAQTAVEKTNSVRVAFDLARQGVITKKEALKKYNDELGDSFGKTNDLVEAERLFVEKAPAYIQIMGLKAQAAALFAKSADETAKGLTAANEDQTTFIQKSYATILQFFGRNAEAFVLLTGQQAEQAKTVKVLADKNAETLRQAGEDLLVQAGKIAEASKIKNVNLADNEKDKKEKEIKGLNALLEQRKKLLQDINDLQRDADQSGLIAEASELDKINEKYDKAILKVEDYNKKTEAFNKKNPNNRVELISDSDIAKINVARTQEVQNQIFKNNAADYIKSLSEQRQAFEDFEQAKVDIGTEKAQELYGVQTRGAASYLEFLKAQKKLIDDDRTPEGFLNIQQKLEIQELDKQITQQTLDNIAKVTKKQIDDYKTLIEGAKTFNDQREAIDKKYAELEKTLFQNPLSDLDKQNERLEALRVEKDKELALIVESELGKNQVYKEFQDKLDSLGAKGLRALIKSLEDLKQKFKDNILLAAALTAAVEKTKAAEAAKSKEEKVDFLKAASSAVGSISNETITITNQLKVSFSQITGAINDLITVFSSGSGSDKVGSIIGVINFLVISVRDAFLTAEDMADPLQAQKDYYTQITDQITAQNFLLERQRNILKDLVGQQKVDGMLGLMEKLKKSEKEALDGLKALQIEAIQRETGYYVDPIFGARPSQGGVTGALVSILTLGQAKKNVEIDLKTVDTSGLKTIEDFANLLAEIKKGGGKLDGKTIVEADIKALETLIDDYDKAIAAQQELKNQLDQIYTGTTANSIADSIIKGFREGKKGAAQFAENFSELMKGAILNSLKYQTLEQPLSAFYQKFSEASGSGGTLTFEEIEALKNDYNSIIENAGKRFEELQKITKINLNESDPANSIQGGIKSITQQQADLLAGQFGGLRMTAFEQLSVARSQLNTLIIIANNTSLLVQIEGYLRKVNQVGVKII